MPVTCHQNPMPFHSEARRVIQVDALDPRWDAFVLAARDATVFHHSGWLTALEKEHGQQSLRLACEEPDGTLAGILPLMATHGLPLGIGGASAGKRLSSLPRTPVCGPVGDSAALRALVQAALAHADSARLRLQLKQAAGTLDCAVPGLQGRPWRLSYVKPLPADPDCLRFGKSRRHAVIMRAVHKAQREGLYVRDAADADDLHRWYRLYLDVNRWRGLPARPYRLFQAAWEHLRPGGFLRLLLACQQQSGHERLLAGSMLLMLGETVFYAFNGRDRDMLSSRPNELLQWHAMRDAVVAGYRWYDFGEVEAGNDGLAAFKAKWGTETRTLMRYHAPPLPPGETGYRSAAVSAWQHRIALGAWRRVPLPITAFIGDQAYRFL